MSQRDKRARLTGRQGVREGERFALIPVEVLESAAFGSLTGMEAKVLVVLAGQFHGYNNGDLTLPLSVAQKYGIRSNDTLKSALKTLRDRGLIELTHQGGLPPFGCSRYALCWREINNPPGSVAPLTPTSKRWIDWADPSVSRRRKPPVRVATKPKSSPVTGRGWSDQRTKQTGN